MAQGITLPVNLQLENLQSIVKDMRSQLGNLKIGSSGYEKVSKVIADIEKRIQNLQVLASRPFVDVKQFNEIQKEILHAKDDLTKLGLEAGKIKFSDISLTSEQSNKLKEFDNQLKSINDQLKQVKESAKTAFLASDAGKAWKEANPVDATKSFEAITLKIEQEVNKQETAIAKAKKAYEEYLNTTQSNEKYKNKINGLLRNGTSLTDMLKQQGLLDQIFTVHNDRFKSNGRSILGDWLKDQFGLSQEAIDSIISESGQKVYQAFSTMSENVQKTLRSEKNRMLADNKQKNAESNNGKTYTDAIASAEASHASAVAAQRSATEADLQAAAAQSELQAQYTQTKEAREEYTQGIVKEAQASASMPQKTEQMRQGLEKVGQGADQAKERLDSFDKAASKLSGISNFINRYIGIYAIMRRVTTAIRNAFNNIKELDKTITNIAVVTNMSQQDLWGKIGEYTQMAQQYGVTTQNVYTVSQLFYQQGLQTSQVMELTTETLKMAKIAGMDYSAAANAMTVAIRAFKIEMSDAQSVTDTYSALAAKFAVSSAEIANAMEKTASSAANVGMSIESTSAFISVMVQTTRESAQNIGSALKSIISRYGEMKASPNELLNIDGEEVAFNKVDTALKSIGISIKDASGQFRDFDDVILELASKWDTLDNNTQRYIATIMAGNRQQSRFIALVSNYDELSRAMNVAENSENASIVQAAKTMDSLESKANQLKNAFSQLYLDLHFEEGLKNVYDILTKIVTTVGKLGIFKGVLPSLMNIIGFGTGTKSLLGYGKEWIDKQKDKQINKQVQADTTEAEEKGKQLDEILAKPVTKKVILDDTEAVARAALLNNPAVTQAMTPGLMGFFARSNPNMSTQEIQDKVYGALATGKLNTEKGRQEFVEGMNVPETSQSQAVESLEQLALAAQKASTGLNQVENSSEKTGKSLENAGQKTENNATRAELSEQKKEESSRRAAQEDEHEAQASREAANADQQEAGTGHHLTKQGVMTGIGIASGVARIVGTVIAAQGAAHQDKSTDRYESSKIRTGIGNGLSMAGTGASMGMALGPAGAAVGGVLGFLFGGLGAIIDGLNFTINERIELAKKEAKEAKDASLKAQSENINLSNSIDNIKALKKAMYNSAEDMKAYKDAMMTMGDTYPQLIATYDEAGQAIIDLEAAEQLLLQTRVTGAKAAREAAVKELEAMNTQYEGTEQGISLVERLYGVNADTTTYYLNEDEEKTLREKWETWDSDNKVTVFGEETANKTFEELTPEELGTIIRRYRRDNSSTFGTAYTLDKLNSELFDMGALNGASDIWEYMHWDKDVPLTSENLTLLLNTLQGQKKTQSAAVSALEKTVNYTKSQEELFTMAHGSNILSTARNSRLQEKGIYSSLFTNFLTTSALPDQYNTLEDWSKDNNKEYTEIVNKRTQQFLEWYNGLSDKQLDILENLDYSEYRSADEILAQLGISQNDPMAKVFADQFTEATLANRNRILKTIFNVDPETGKILDNEGWNTDLEGLASLDDQQGKILKNFQWAFSEGGPLITKYADFFTEQLLEVNDLAERGYTELANTRLKTLESLRYLLSLQPRQVQQDLFGIITNINFTDYNSIYDANEQIKKYGLENNIDVSEYTRVLEGALDDLVFNANTLTDSIFNKLIDTSKEISSIISTQNSGLSIDQALEKYAELRIKLGESLGDFDQIFQFNPILGKYVYTADGFVKVINHEQEELKKETERLNQIGEDYKTILNSMPEAPQLTLQPITDTSLFGSKYNNAESFKEQIHLWYSNLSDSAIQFIIDSMQQQGKELTGFNFVQMYNEKLANELDADKIMSLMPVDEMDDRVVAEARGLAEQFIADDSISHTWADWITFLNKQNSDIAKKIAINAQESEATVKDLTNQLFQQIDWSAIATGSDFAGSNQLLVKTLSEALGITAQSWEDVQLAYFNKIYDDLYGTDEQLQNDAEKLAEKNKAKQAAISAAYGQTLQAQSEQATNAITEILAGEGQVLSTTTIALLNDKNVNLEFYADGVRQAGKDVVETAIELFETCKDSFLSIAERNAAYSEIIKKSYEQNNTILDTYKSASSLSTDAIDNLFNAFGLNLDEAFDAQTKTWFDGWEDIFQTDIFGNTRIIDWEAFNRLIARQLTPEEYAQFIETDEYLSAFKAYNNSLIEMDRKVAKEITSEVKSIGEAKRGERLNISYLWSSMDANLQAGLVTLLKQYDATIEDGILTLGNAANIPQILSAVAAAAREAGQLLPSEIAELNDALINYFKSLNDLISKGISGTLTNVEATSLSESFNLDLNADFIRTADGLKLTHEAALKVYNDIKNIDSTAGNITFKALSDSLIETDEHYKTISSTLARIKELTRLIANEKPNSARRQQYEQELALAREIAAVRATTEDDTYNFMSNKLPGGQNNPLNYFSNWQKGWKVFTDAKKSGYMDYTDFFNLFTEMGHMAEATGQKIQIGANEFLTNSTDAAKLIEAGAGALEVDATTGELRVNLAKLASIGVDFSAAGEKMDKDVTDGIKKYAESQVKMLDGMIQMLETVVAMEKLGDVAGENNKIDLTDLFPTFVNPDQRRTIINKNAINWINDVLATDNKDLQKALDEILINGRTFREWMIAAKDTGLTKEEAKTFTSMLDTFYQMYLSGEYDINSIFESMKAVAASTGFEGTIKFGDMELTFTNGEIYTKVEENGQTKFIDPDGNKYNTLEEARASSIYKYIDSLNKDRENTPISYDKEVGTVTLEIKGEKVQLKIDEDGYLSYQGQTFKSINEYIKYVYSDELQDGTYANVEEILIDQKFKIVPTISSDGKLTPEQITAIRNNGVKTAEQLWKEWESAAEEGKQYRFTAKYGFSLEGVEFTEEQMASINEQLADETKTITYTVVNESALKAIDEVRRALALIPNSKTTYVDIKERKESTTASTPAAGKNATAEAKGTLMGELGPEMVVSNGRYFIVGQNGPEMIDLADDAIVFNHLQTKSLLEKGITSTRGKAVTNERNAVSFAKGNVHGGPAQASAQEALETLRQLRAMWKAIGDMSAKDLAGKGGGGGGGGGNNAAFVKELERWYNYLQEIAKLEEKITYEETLRSKINSDFYKDGYEYYRSQMRSAKDLTREIATQKQLVEEQQKYFEARRKQMNDASNPFSMLYTFDEAGQLKYRDGAFAKLSELASSDPLTGTPNHTLQEQYDKLIAWGYGDYMRYDESGKEIDTKDEAGLKSAVEAFWAKIEADRTEMQELHDSVEEHKKALLEKQEEQNQILKDIEDNQISLEGKVLKAIEDAAQREIDTLSDQKDAIQKANTALIDGLTNALQKEQQMYQNQQNQEELTRLQRQLGILQRSGGSASQIRDLQKQIDEKNRDMYFNKQQEQIDAIQEASDKEIERLEQQIDLMTETLEYQKANGLLWEQVYAIMNENTAEDIAEFIKQNDAEYWAKSPTDMAQTMRDVLFSAEQWKAFAEDGGMTGIKAELDALMALLEKAYGDQQKADEAAAAAETNDATNTNTNSGSGGGNDNSMKNAGWNVVLDEKQNKYVALKAENGKYKTWKEAEFQRNLLNGSLNFKNKKVKATQEVVSADVGGILDEDQLALVHAKEAVFTPEQTSILRNDILGHSSDSLLNLLSDFRTAWAGMASSGDYNSIDRSSSVVIEHAEVNMKVDKLANNYDAARAGKDVMEEMLHIASKTRAQNRVI